MTVNIEVKARGPLFDRSNANLMRKTIERTVRQVVEEGEEHIAGLLRPRPSGVYLSFAEAKKGQASTGNYRRRMNTSTRGLTGKISDGGVEYGPWLEGTSSRNQSTHFKGYHVYRRTVQWLNRVRVAKILNKHMRRATGRLNGI
jgi:hypothetical protein